MCINVWQICQFSFSSGLKNIAKGTTDPGYWVYNLNYLFDYIEFVFNLAEEVTQVLDSIAWVRCASDNDISI